MKLAISLFAACLYAQGPATSSAIAAREQKEPAPPGITDAQRIKFRELERDYYRTQVLLGTIQQQIIAQHQTFEQLCRGPIDETTLDCKGKKTASETPEAKK